MSERRSPPGEPGASYPSYVLGVLVLVYVFNFLDRQILSILAERIRADLGVTDAQLGFLYGTAFAVFYAVVRHPARPPRRRLGPPPADRARARGLEPDDGALRASRAASRSWRAARIGVGIGEASASPAAFSLLSDYFPAARRATALAIYSSGIYLGAGLGLVVGGLVVERWDAAFRRRGAPFGLRGWQVAFFVVGTAGVCCSRSGCATLREPTRGAQRRARRAARAAARSARSRSELRAVLPPLTLVHLALAGAGARALARNLVAAAIIAAVAARAHAARSAARRSGSRSGSASTPRCRGCRRSRCATRRRSH